MEPRRRDERIATINDILEVIACIYIICGARGLGKSFNTRWLNEQREVKVAQSLGLTARPPR